MATPSPLSAARATTLPQALARQARERGARIALRHKRHGIWHPLTWREVEHRVRRLATGLAARGFTEHDELLLISGHPAPAAVFLTLAAQALGGSVIPIEPSVSEVALERLLRASSPRFAFVEAHTQVELLRRAAPEGKPALRTLIYLDGRALIHDDHSALISYEKLLDSSAEGQATTEAAARGDRPAFLFPRNGADEPALAVTHDELLALGRHVVARERLHDRHEALVSRGFATSAHARYVLGPWLSGGFRLNFPETVSTRDADRRELGPTLVVGTRDTFGRLARRTADRLPPVTTWRRRFIDWALRPGDGWLTRALGHWLVRRPLRDVLGFSRTAVPLVIGAALTPETDAFFARLGVRPRRWPDPNDASAARSSSAETTPGLLPSEHAAAVPA